MLLIRFRNNDEEITFSLLFGSTILFLGRHANGKYFNGEKLLFAVIFYTIFQTCGKLENETECSKVEKWIIKI